MNKNSHKIPAFILPCILAAVLITVCAEANPFFAPHKSAAPPPVISTGSPVMKIQFEFRDKISDILRNIKDNKSGISLSLLLLFSFLYGFFHALGPGHRKTVIFSLFLSRNSRPLEPLWVGLIAAMLHAGTSVVLVFSLWLITSEISTLSRTDNAYAFMEGVTFMLLFLFSLFVIVKHVFEIINNRKAASPETKKRGLYSLIILSSIVPCPGATMLLLLSLYLELPLYGIIGVFSMSAGMAVIMAAAGYAAYAGRKGLFFKFEKKKALLSVMSTSFEILSFTIILLFSAYMMWPFIRSLG